MPHPLCLVPCELADGPICQQRYTVIEHEPIFAASDEKVSHSARSGDLDRGKAWRSVKRPSDMVQLPLCIRSRSDPADIPIHSSSQNEYADEIREIRMREKPGRAHAKVFVKSTSQGAFKSSLSGAL